MKLILNILILFGIHSIFIPSSDAQCFKDNCAECIRSYGCIWCSDPNFTDKRCRNETDKKCNQTYVVNPAISVTNVVANDLTIVTKRNDKSGDGATNGSGSKKVVQVYPQRSRIKLRVNQNHPLRIKMSYRQAVDSPVDLYYLMDLSNSMADDKDTLSLLGDKLAETMNNLTGNFRLGFGSFVDKVALPYVSTLQKSLESPCANCAAPYGFRNVMTLSQNTSDFAVRVKNASVSGNLDAPEGGFDAIMQAIVCNESIGWRNDARKMLVFSTDSTFHYAGDGKLAGIVKPNDGCCHLNRSGYYTHSILQDYPSVSQINKKVKDHSINIIFAVTEDKVGLYTDLGKQIEGSTTGKLSNDSQNVVDLVLEQYNKITSSIEFRTSGVTENFQLTFYSRCLNTNGALVKTTKCDGIKVNQTIEFEIDIELVSCPADRNNWNQTFTIYPVGISEDYTINVEMMCDCDCQNLGPEFFQNKSSKCSGHGTLKCGVCECEQDFYGDDCSCTTEQGKTDKCHSGDVNSRTCSDRGTCKCNRCSCFRGYYGELCECDDFSCRRTNGELCAKHGKCECGVCKCHEGWSNDGCSCDDSQTNCIAPNSTDICSGPDHGTCVCNKCVCNATAGYHGSFCDKCPTCKGKCPELKECVQCKVHKSGPYTKEQCDACNISINIAEYVEATDYYCRYTDEQDCEFKYTYDLTSKGITVTAQKNRECPPQARILGVVFFLVLGIVVLGLACLLIWKLVTSMKDSREYAKFMKEQSMAKWDAVVNPIYKQATSTFKNPTYIGKCD